MALTREEEVRYPRAASRIREYAEKRALESAANDQLSQLEAQVEEEERRNLRLTRELNEEVALRARAERRLKEETTKVEDLTRELQEARENEIPQPIKKPAKPRKAPAKRAPKPKPVDPAAQPVSSRKRGSVK